MKIFYTYALIDPRDNLPFYIGKGKGKRMMHHEQTALGKRKDSQKPHYDRIREIISAGLNVTYKKVLQDVTEKEALNEERKLIELYGRKHCGTGILLNISRGGYNSGTTEKPVSQYTLTGDFIADFPSAKVASEQVSGANATYISSVCKNKRRSAGGFLWAYKGNQPAKYERNNTHAVVQFSSSGEKIATYSTVSELAKILNVSISTISATCTGKAKNCCGYILRYVDDENPISLPKRTHKRRRKVIQLTTTGEVIGYYNSIKEASSLTGIGKAHINRVCSKKYNAITAGGFLWEYVD